MTEPKEEKCEACCGSGYINFWTDDGHISMRTCRRCDGYGYIKVKPMTNEEYLKSCNTEQLADWLAERMDTPCDICRYDCRSKCMANAKQVWLEWLKEIHK